MATRLTRLEPTEVRPATASRSLAEARAVADPIVSAVRAGGRRAMEAYALQFEEIEAGQSIVVPRERLEAARASLDAATEACLLRTHARIARFAEAQRASIQNVDVELSGGYRAGHRLLPIPAVGCYVPGGRFPLVSSLLMTAVPARVAGVPRVVVASPRPSEATLAAAHIAGVDDFLCIGGAHAIAALAYGCEHFDGVDFICGPGNRYVTAAKQLVFGDVGIDMLAGPSEVVVVADASCDAGLVAADLLAQAEHDVDACATLVTTDAAYVAEVEAELERALGELPDPSTAREALRRNGRAIACADFAEAAAICNVLAPEHLEVFLEGPMEVFESYGALFVGPRAGEVLGDYGVGPNHVLPTASSARARGGLSVFDFLRVATYLDGGPSPELEVPSVAAEADQVLADVVSLARVEGLEAHARAGELRRRREL